MLALARQAVAAVRCVPHSVVAVLVNACGAGTVGTSVIDRAGVAIFTLGLHLDVLASSRWAAVVVRADVAVFTEVVVRHVVARPIRLDRVDGAVYAVVTVEQMVAVTSRRVAVVLRVRVIVITVDLRPLETTVVDVAGVVRARVAIATVDRDVKTDTMRL